MTQISKIIFFSIFIFALVSSVSAYPPIPAEFYGTITINGASAPIGTIITALIDGVEVGTFTTTSIGGYGGAGNFKNRLIVQGKETDLGKTIVFRINSVSAGETATFNTGVSQQRDLTIVTGTSPGQNTPPIETSNNLQMVGLQFTVASPGTASQANISIAELESSGSHMTVSGSTVTITSTTFSLIMPAAGSINENEEDGTLIFTPQSIQLNTKPVSENINTVGEVTATIQANLNNIPDGAQINTTISQQPTSAVSTSFQLAATTSSLKIDDVAYTLNVERQNIADGTNIANATIQMSISPEWVTEHGGISSIRLIRTGDDGNSQVLDTTFAGYDSAGRMVFEGYSPNGLSTFGLVTTTSTVSSSSASGGGSSRGSSGSFTSSNPTQPRTFIGTGKLGSPDSKSPPNTIISSLVTILSKDSIAAFILNKGITVKDRAGNPIPEISINTLPATDISLPSGSGIDFVGYAYEFGPDGTSFDPPATLVFTIPKEKWNTLNLEKLSVRQYNPSSKTWDPIDTRVNSATKSVTASIAHFTRIGLFQTSSSGSTNAQPIIAAVVKDVTVKGKTGDAITEPMNMQILFNPLLLICSIGVIVIGAVAIHIHKRRTIDHLTLEPYYSSQPLIDQNTRTVMEKSGVTKVILESSRYEADGSTDRKTMPSDMAIIVVELNHMKEVIQHKNEVIEELKTERDWLREQVTKLHEIISNDKKE